MVRRHLISSSTAAAAEAHSGELSRELLLRPLPQLALPLTLLHQHRGVHHRRVRVLRAAEVRGAGERHHPDRRGHPHPHPHRRRGHLQVRRWGHHHPHRRHLLMLHLLMVHLLLVYLLLLLVRRWKRRRRWSHGPLRPLRRQATGASDVDRFDPAVARLLQAELDGAAFP